jgi:hypothetical protein
VRTAFERATRLGDVVRRAGELAARTMIFDVEPLVAYRGGGQEADGSSCRAAAGGYLRRLVRPLLYTAASALSAHVIGQARPSRHLRARSASHPGFQWSPTDNSPAALNCH